MKDDSPEQFWREKEREHKSPFVIASAAEYLGGYPGLAGPLNGLLYVLRNGIYFENFKDTAWLRGVFRDVFHVDEDFAKVSLALKNKDIVDVSCFPGQKDKFRLTVKERLASLAGLIPRRLIVTYRHPRGACPIVFSCAQSPIRLCAAFYGAHPKSAGHAGKGKKR
jgi:hypothetical protein